MTSMPGSPKSDDKGHPVGVIANTSKPWQTINNLELSLILQTLPDIPISVHNPHLHTSIPPTCYEKAPLSVNHVNNRGKEFDIRGAWNTVVRCTFYPRGQLDIVPVDSQFSHRVENVEDVRAFIDDTEQVRNGISRFLGIQETSIIPSSAKWRLSYIEVSKDIDLPEEFRRYKGLTIDLGDFLDTVTLYIKEIGDRTVLRPETDWQANTTLLDALLELISPYTSLKKRLDILTKEFLSQAEKSHARTSKRKQVDFSQVQGELDDATLGIRADILPHLADMIPKGEPLLTCSDCGRIIHVGAIDDKILSYVMALLRDHIYDKHNRSDISEIESDMMEKAGVRRKSRILFY